MANICHIFHAIITPKEVWPLLPVRRLNSLQFHTVDQSCIMSLTESQGESLTSSLDVSSNPKSKWPVLCQTHSGPSVLQSSVFCTVSQDMKGWLVVVHTALGVSQTFMFIFWDIFFDVNFKYDLTLIGFFSSVFNFGCHIWDSWQ